MKSSFYRQKWADLKSGAADAQETKRLPRQVAYSFMDAYLKDCHYEDDHIRLLCEMATAANDAMLNKIAARALFGIIIESLCDDFEELQIETYNRVMAQIISFCRRLPMGRLLDRRLNDFKIHSQDDLLQRIHKIRTDSRILSARRDVKKILLLSRVTIGADVAITSVIIQRLAQLFPAAQLVLIGDAKLQQIYAGNSRVRLQKVHYDRQGDLLQRLSSWQTVLAIIEQELESCPLEQTILVDPDSRLLQLGVMPIVPAEHYFFFDSRSNASFSANMSMAQLTNAWLDRLTGVSDFRYPRVWLAPANLSKAAEFCGRLKKNGARRLIAVNFGVGGNPRKKVGAPMEQSLLLALLAEAGTVILLDKGSGDAELRSCNALMAAVKKHGHPVEEALFGDGLDSRLSSGLIGLQTSIGEIAAVIAHCDEYIGYDSAGQHIAAALEIPCLTIFAGSNNMRFIRRWSAFGPNSSKIVHVDTLSDPGAIDVEDIITRITNERSLMNAS